MSLVSAGADVAATEAHAEMFGVDANFKVTCIQCK